MYIPKICVCNILFKIQDTIMTEDNAMRITKVDG